MIPAFPRDVWHSTEVRRLARGTQRTGSGWNPGIRGFLVLKYSADVPGAAAKGPPFRSLLRSSPPLSLRSWFSFSGHSSVSRPSLSPCSLTALLSLLLCCSTPRFFLWPCISFAALPPLAAFLRAAAAPHFVGSELWASVRPILNNKKLPLILFQSVPYDPALSTWFLGRAVSPLRFNHLHFNCSEHASPSYLPRSFRHPHIPSHEAQSLCNIPRCHPPRSFRHPHIPLHKAQSLCDVPRRSPPAENQDAVCRRLRFLRSPPLHFDHLQGHMRRHVFQQILVRRLRANPHQLTAPSHLLC